MRPKTLFHRRYTTPGASPGAIVGADAGPVTWTALRYEGGDLDEQHLASVEEACALKDGKGVLWLDVHGVPTERELLALGERFGLHPLALADIANLGQRPKVEEYDDFLFCVLRMATVEPSGAVHWEQVALCLGKDFLLTFQEDEGDCLEPLRVRIRSGRGSMRTSRHDYLAVMVIDAIVDGYFPILELYGDALEDLEHEVMTDPSRDDLNEIYRIKRELMTFRRAAWPLRDTLNQVLRDKPALLSKNVMPYLRDTIDHLMQIVDVVETYRELSTSFIDVYLSSIGQRTNEIMRLLTVMASIFIPLTFLAGVYGMNFDTSKDGNMPELSMPHAYEVFWLVCGGVAIAMTVLFHRLGWLRRPD